jgi:hypothetical protein
VGTPRLQSERGFDGLSTDWGGSGPRSSLLAKALEGIDVHALDEDLGKRAGELLARARRSDVIDAAPVLLASDGDVVATSDSNGLKPLARAAERVVDSLMCD